MSLKSEQPLRQWVSPGQDALAAGHTSVSLALVLLIGSVLLIRTFIALQAVEPSSAHATFSRSKCPSTASASKSMRRRTTLAQQPRPAQRHFRRRSSATTYWLPDHVGDTLPSQIVRAVDKDHQFGSRWISISPAYLDVFKIPVLRGRSFNENDTAEAPSVALINEAMAKRYWPGKYPVGQQIAISKGLGEGLEESSPTIVGVVGDTHNAGLDRPPDPVVIRPIAQVTDAYTASYSNGQPLLWVVRTRDDPHDACRRSQSSFAWPAEGFR